MRQPDIPKIDPFSGTVVREAVEIVKAAQPPIGLGELVKLLSEKGYAEAATRTGVWSEIHVPGEFFGIFTLNQNFTLGINTRYPEPQVNARLKYWDQQTVGKRSPNVG